MLITRCRIDTGDDCIAVKAGARGSGPSEDILVTDCTFLRTATAARSGATPIPACSNMTVERCTFDGTDAGVRLKSRRGRGGLLRISPITDLTMKNVGQAIVDSSYYYGLPKPGMHDDSSPCMPTPRSGATSDRNVTATGGTKDAGLIIGLPEMPAREISLENVSIGARAGFA